MSRSRLTKTFEDLVDEFGLWKLIFHLIKLTEDFTKLVRIFSQESNKRSKIIIHTSKSPKNDEPVEKSECVTHILLSTERCEDFMVL